MGTHAQSTQYLKRIGRKSHHDFYIQLVSIICSLALAHMLQSLQIKRLYGDESTVSYALQNAAIFWVIVLVWHEYAISTAYLRWVVSLTDSLIPFLFGVGMFALIEATNSASDSWWFFWFAVFCCLGATAYFNQSVSSKRDESNKKVISRFRRMNRWAIGISLICSVAAIAMAVATASSAWDENELGLFYSIVLIALLVFTGVVNHVRDDDLGLNNIVKINAFGLFKRFKTPV